MTDWVPPPQDLEQEPTLGAGLESVQSTGASGRGGGMLGTHSVECGLELATPLEQLVAGARILVGEGSLARSRGAEG